jgi:FixJ family two-component response regulator
MIPQPQVPIPRPRRGLVRVVDDEPAILELFRQICQHEGLELQAFPAAAPFLAALADDAPGCVVLDLNLPDRPGLEVLGAMAAAGCPLPVVCMSGRAGVHDAVAAFKLGSLDFVEKPFALDEIVGAIHRAIDTDRERRAHAGEQRELRARFQSMTRREREVMDLVVSGLPNKLIATRLGVSPKTVEVHRAHVMQKSRAGSLAELVRLSIAAGIAPTWREPVAG